MFENTKCECGHQNPLGTLLCESCGKPLEDKDGTAPLEMRYDGMARRSQKENPALIDRVWNFFSSVKIAVYLIIITLLASALGTVFPQENTFISMDPSVYYKETYGTLGDLYYRLGLSHTFDSWWFIGLLFMIGTSLVVCSLDRVLPLYRALNKQQIRKHLSFILRQKVSYEGELPAVPVQTEGETSGPWMKEASQALRKKHYRVHLDSDGQALLAEKYRFSRWGPYINHIGLIIFLLAVLARSIPGWHMDQYMGFLEGRAVKVPETPYYLKNEKFTVDYYSEEEMSEGFKERQRDVPKTYMTKAVLYECTENCDDPSKEPVLKEVHQQNIEVNKPLQYKGFMAYQFDYKETPMLLSVNPTLKNPQTGEAYGKIHVPMFNPPSGFDAGPYHLEIKNYFPDFGLDDKGQPMTKSRDPKAPAFIFTITGPGLDSQGDVYLYFPRQVDRQIYRQDELNGKLAQKLDLSASSMDDVEIAAYTSYLNIRKDTAMPYIWVGAAISMIGLIMGFYWQHRRIWLRIDGNRLALGAHTNKNWFGIRKEVADVLHKTGIVVDSKSLEAGGPSS
ncbi:cytochrome c biogenesis protein ResB [Paenibacillus aurantius]|uniref:Cytochrome c biogenesis protein ResB n=1 Tax=Paenibacillus aurantius TaxID=2918900 RepID=A0AA96RBA9_9BACL|nr:cytochrome c biogenesis protein ResB [Paenibacillus aurantius]WNQ09325.1 cytochrome c biogenesis protein ResB [Paenibacillus aurantius]